MNERSAASSVFPASSACTPTTPSASATETSVTLPPADDRAASGAGASTARRDRRRARFLTLHVHGRLLPPADAPPGDADRDLEGEPKFDAFVRRLEVRLDPAPTPTRANPARRQAPDGPGWTTLRERRPHPLDAFEVKRHGDRDCRGQDRPHRRSPTGTIQTLPRTRDAPRHRHRDKTEDRPSALAVRRAARAPAPGRSLRGATGRAVTRGFSDAEGGGGGRVRPAGGTARRSARCPRPP